MARGHIASITPDADGTLMPAATTGDAANDHTVTNTGKTIIIITNTNGVSTSHVAQMEIDRTVQGVTPAPLSRTIAAGERWIFGALPIADFGRLLRVNVDHAELKIDVIEP